MLFGGPDWPEKPLIDQAEGGTLCLEDIEALSPAAQARLLDVINATDPERAARRASTTSAIVAVSSRLGHGAPPARCCATTSTSASPGWSSRRRRCGPAARTS